MGLKKKKVTNRRAKKCVLPNTGLEAYEGYFFFGGGLSYNKLGNIDAARRRAVLDRRPGIPIRGNRREVEQS